MAKDDSKTDDKKKDADVESKIEDCKAAVEEGKDKAKDDSDDEGIPGTPGSKRRFFPRVKHLLTREWEFVSAR